MRIRFATSNAPESMKRGLLRDRLARATRVLRFYVRRRIDVGALQESGTYAERVAEHGPIKAIYAKFNDFVNGRRVGNGIYVKRRRWKTLQLPDLVIGTGDDAIHVARAQITHRDTGFTFTFRAWHKPTRRADNAELRAVADDKMREEQRLDNEADRAWVDAGDFNGSAAGGVELGSHGPDHIRASHHFEPAGQKVIDRPLLSDHHFLIADAEV